MLLRDYFLGSLRDAFRNRGPLSPSQITTSMGSTSFFFSLSSALVHLTKKTVTAIPCHVAPPSMLLGEGSSV
jgi:hypothetical protein